MRLDDIRLGRWITIRQTLVSIPAATDTVLMTYDKNRVLMSARFVAGADIFHVNTAAMTAVNQGVYLSPFTIPLFALNLWDDGQLVQKEWHVWPTAANSGLMLFEGLLPEEALRQCLCELKKR